MHRGMYERTQTLENSKFVEPQYDIEEISKSKPIFVQPLSDPKPVGEGKNIHLECRLEPLGDPTMRVEWFVMKIIIFNSYNKIPFYFQGSTMAGQ